MGRHWNMSGRIPPIKSVMTAFPYSISVEAEIGEALGLMARHRIRHLPVKRGDELVGVVNERDAARADAGQPVAVAMYRAPFVVGGDRPLDQVLLEMLERHVDCVLVMHEQRLAGIFTSMDACRLLGDALHRLSGRGPGDEVA